MRNLITHTYRFLYGKTRGNDSVHRSRQLRRYSNSPPYLSKWLLPYSINTGVRDLITPVKFLALNKSWKATKHTSQIKSIEVICVASPPPSCEHEVECSVAKITTCCILRVTEHITSNAWQADQLHPIDDRLHIKDWHPLLLKFACRYRCTFCIHTRVCCRQGHTTLNLSPTGDRTPFTPGCAAGRDTQP